ncbi:MAG: hypothetical protein HZB39_06195 [Planctomycetes bacterium]|nr:hypothetical protein [Planctomycetota bacterium]
MALSFAVIETTMTPLWDFGWFDLTRFAVNGSAGKRQDSSHVLREFLSDPISQRSFCDLGHWGESVQRHGPFPHDRVVVEWFRAITPEELMERIRAVLDDPEFAEPPGAEQRRPLEAWVETVDARGDVVFALDAPEQVHARVDWDFVWMVYREFVSVSPNRDELSVGVIGYD